jgi:hypothetical protein
MLHGFIPLSQVLDRIRFSGGRSVILPSELTKHLVHGKGLKRLG